MNRRIALVVSLVPLALAAACSSPSTHMSKTFDQSGVPEAVKVPAGHQVALETIGVGQITYECRVKANAVDAHEWVFVGPQADLNSRSGTKLGTYFGPPATWASVDGSKITGAQLAVAPNGAGNIPAQLVKANPAMGSGAMTGVTYVQRVATQGGVPPGSVCDKSGLGRKEIVKYQADYIFWKAA